MLPLVNTGIRNEGRLLHWRDVYREAELYKAAVRVYTKPLFHWRKALHVSTDGNTLYDLAGRGLKGLAAIHQQLRTERFQFRPSVGLKYNFNGKRRTLYIPPWEERIVDLLLYRILNGRLHSWFSPNSYAYRDRTYGLDRCQSRIAAVLRSARTHLYVVKRDISDYFASVDHEILLRELMRHIDADDYLFRLIEQRVRFNYQDETGAHRAEIGIPFGCASACVLANVYLTGLDWAIENIPEVHYFRYADDMLVLSIDRQAAMCAAQMMTVRLTELRLNEKASRSIDVLLGDAAGDSIFEAAAGFRHLGLEFRSEGHVSLSREKRRKIQNLFRFAFRRSRRRWKKISDPRERARTLCAIASQTIERGVRNVAIVDYYLKHVTDTTQLQSLDRWLAEEVLSLVFGGHNKGHFAKISFEELRSFRLPSLVHRRRLILHRKIDSPFFIWQQQKFDRAFKGTVANRAHTVSAASGFSPHPEAAAQEKPVREGGRLYMGVME
ncbi:MAG TPA: reverse transcriptase/maturase family protein [Dongiaceae bacterium]|nr:reverse transcriptase/maturase family protein [Dongiaceae bacterium]